MKSGERVGSLFGPYRLTRLLGRDGLGEVYEAHEVHEAGDTGNGRVLALKLISEQFSDNAVLAARLRHEAEAAAKLTDPHIVPVYAHGEIDGRLYLVTGLIHGTDLGTLLRESGPLSPPRAVAIIRQVAAALDAAHHAGVTHRGVKPENILVTDEDRAYLKDFGIASAAFDPELASEPGKAETPATSYSYMAPERLHGSDVGEAAHLADVYSLACVLTECLTGSPPFPADSGEQAAEVLEARLVTAPPRPSRLRPGRVPAALDEVVARGLARKPADRYPAAGDLGAAAYEALTEPERNQAARILRRSEAGASLIGHAEQAVQQAAQPAPKPAAQPEPQPVSPPPPAPVPVPQRGWTPPDSDRDGLASVSVDELSAGPARLLDFKPSPRATPRLARIRHLRRPVVLAAAAVAAVGIVVAAGHLASRPAQEASAAAPSQTVLPFNDLDYRLAPGGVALDADGNVYVTSQATSGQVLKLPAGSTTPTALPVNGIYQPRGVAVDHNGTVYFSDFNNRVVKVAPESNAQTVLPFYGLDSPEGVAVDSGGNVYVADRGNNLVMKLDSGSNTQIVLPFSGLGNPDGVAVDGAGNVYVTDTGNNRVLKLSPGSNQQAVLPFTGIIAPWGIAVDEHGSVYVTERDSNKVVELASGALIPNVLPFVGLNTPLDVAVDKNGNVYVADRGNDRVVMVSSDVLGGSGGRDNR